MKKDREKNHFSYTRSSDHFSNLEGEKGCFQITKVLPTFFVFLKATLSEEKRKSFMSIAHVVVVLLFISFFFGIFILYFSSSADFEKVSFLFQTELLIEKINLGKRYFFNIYFKSLTQLFASCYCQYFSFIGIKWKN